MAFFSPIFSKYVLFVWNKLCPPIKWLIFRRVWWLLMLLTVLELISQSSNFSRITTLRNGVFSPLFSKYVRFVWNKLDKLCPPIKWLIFRRAWWLLILLTVLELISLRFVSQNRINQPATRYGHTSQRQITSCVPENFCEKIFFSATEFCRGDKSHKFCLIWFFCAPTCCGDKILLRRQRFSQKFSSTHGGEICRRIRIAATGCCNLAKTCPPIFNGKMKNPFLLWGVVLFQM